MHLQRLNRHRHRDTELDCGALDDDYILDVRGFKQTIVREDGVDASEIIMAAARLVPPVEHFATFSSQFGAPEVAFRRTNDDRRVETRDQPGLICGAKLFGTRERTAAIHGRLYSAIRL